MTYYKICRVSNQILAKHIFYLFLKRYIFKTLKSARELRCSTGYYILPETFRSEKYGARPIPRFSSHLSARWRKSGGVRSGHRYRERGRPLVYRMTTIEEPAQPPDLWPVTWHDLLGVEVGKGWHAHLFAAVCCRCRHLAARGNWTGDWPKMNPGPRGSGKRRTPTPV